MLKWLLSACILISPTIVLGINMVFTNEVPEWDGSDFVIDINDEATTDIDLQFGTSLTARIRFDVGSNEFQINQNVNFENNQLIDVRFENSATSPTCDGTTLGRSYYDTTQNTSYICDGSVWQPMGYHAITHINGEDDIPIATETTKGLMSAAFVQELNDLSGESAEINRNTIDNNLVLGENVSGGVAYLTYENPNDTGFIANIENVEFPIANNTSPGIALTGGTDTNPTLNYVYVRDTGLVESSTTDPATQAFDWVPIGEVLLGNVGVSSATYFYIENLTNFIRNFIRDVNNRFRVDGTVWLNGINPTTSGLDIAVSSGEVMHIHETEFFPGVDTASGGTMIDEFYNVYTELDNTNYDDGTGGDAAIGNNKYHKIFIWGDIYGGLHMERQREPPTSEYTSQEQAYDDFEEVAINSVPTEWKDVGFPIAHIIMHETSGVLQIIDLRSGGSGGGGGGGNHDQNTDTGTSSDSFTLDNDNTATDISLIFGTTLNESLTWDDINNRFNLSDDLRINGNLATSGQLFQEGLNLTLDSDNVGAGSNTDIISNQGSDNDGTLRYNATDNRWEISNDGGSFSPILVPQVFEAYDNSGNTSLTTTQTVLNLNATRISDSAYTLASNEITFNTDGVYLINGRLTADSFNTTGAQRSSIQLAFQSDTGGGFGNVEGTLCQDYMREQGNGTSSASCSVSWIGTFNATDAIRMTHRITGTTTAQTVPEASGLTIQLIREN